MYDFDATGLINDVIQPQLEDSRFVKPYNDLVAQFTENPVNPGGGSIVHQIKTSTTSNARHETKADVDPVAGTFDAAVAKWTLIYQETAAEVHNIDINQAANGGLKGVRDLMTSAIADEMDGLWSLIYDDIYAQIKADLLASGTYSDEALSRLIYPTLAPYNDVTNTQVTVAIVRALMYGTRLNKNTTPKNTYRLVIEPAVLEVLRPQVALLNTWNAANSGNAPIDAGYAPIGTFEESPVYSVQGMTTGDLFYVRKQDVIITKHRNLVMTPVPSGRDSIKVNIRCGIQAHVINVGKQGMATNKD